MDFDLSFLARLRIKNERKTEYETKKKRSIKYKRIPPNKLGYR